MWALPDKSLCFYLFNFIFNIIIDFMMETGEKSLQLDF